MVLVTGLRDNTNHMFAGVPDDSWSGFWQAGEACVADRLLPVVAGIGFRPASADGEARLSVAAIAKDVG
jgi:hypothetical protein